MRGILTAELAAPRPAVEGRAREQRLVRQFLARRDPELFAQLVRPYEARLLRLAAGVLGPGFDSEAEDVVQDALVQAFRHLHGFRFGARFSTWLYRIAYRKAIDRRRRARYRLPHLDERALDSLPSAEDPEQSYDKRKHENRLQEAVGRLPSPYREIVYLHYWLDTPVAEIADLLAKPEGTIKSYLHRARGKLRRRLDS